MKAEQYRAIEEYCRNEFYLSSEYKKRKSIHQGSWCRYKEFEIEGDRKLKVVYEYGDISNSFEGIYRIQLGEDYRDKKILEILSSR